MEWIRKGKLGGDVCTSRISRTSAFWKSRSVFHLFDKVRLEGLADDYLLLRQPKLRETDQYIYWIYPCNHVCCFADWPTPPDKRQLGRVLNDLATSVLTGHVEIHSRWFFSLLLPFASVWKDFDFWPCAELTGLAADKDNESNWTFSIFVFALKTSNTTSCPTTAVRCSFQGICCVYA